ncbi:DUF2474 family protein [Marinobacter sp.]
MKLTTKQHIHRWLWLLGIWSASVATLFICTSLLKLAIPT